MSKLTVNSYEEYNELVATYNSKGFALFTQFIDGEIKRQYDSMMKTENDKEVVASVNKIKGLSIAKQVAFNVIKENEERYKK